MNDGKINLLFVCIGNICRSPSAEAVMRSLVEKENLSAKIVCDSVGTNGLHDGEQADPRSRADAEKRGIAVTSISRRSSVPDDFDRADYIIAMDDRNIRDLKNLDRHEKHAKKLFKLTDFSASKDWDHVPDPYYGDAEGFETVLDILEEACAGLLAKIKADHRL